MFVGNLLHENGKNANEAGHVLFTGWLQPPYTPRLRAYITDQIKTTIYINVLFVLQPISLNCTHRSLRWKYPIIKVLNRSNFKDQ